MRKWLTWSLIFLVAVAGCGGNGDRVLVSKCYYDGTPWNPRRHDVVVFRFPQDPLQDGTPTNYIKRLIGLAGETIAIFLGQLFVATDIDYSGAPQPEDESNRRLPQYMYSQFPENQNAIKAFQSGKFKIIRKSPKTMLSMRRIVYDNDYQADDLRKIGFPRRWQFAPDSGWKAENEDRDFRFTGKGEQIAWLRYQHILRPADWPSEEDPSRELLIEQIRKRSHSPQLITDFSGYNSYNVNVSRAAPMLNWVGDLMLEFEVTVEEPSGELAVELACGIDRFQTIWNLEDGECRLLLLREGEKPKQLSRKATSLKGAGTFQVRVANFDERITVWVNRELPFGEGVEYERPWHFVNSQDKWVNTGPHENDLKRPASIGIRGGKAAVRHLRLWRDTYYVVWRGEYPSQEALFNVESPEWTRLREHPPLMTMFVQPGHYLCLGDNSPESSDSREWGLVPKHLLLGRALMVYWPWHRVGTIIH